MYPLRQIRLIWVCSLDLLASVQITNLPREEEMVHGKGALSGLPLPSYDSSDSFSDPCVDIYLKCYVCSFLF